MKRNASASTLHESVSLLDETNKIKLETTIENVLNNRTSSCTNTGGSQSHYVKSLKEIIMGRIYVARTG